MKEITVAATLGNLARVQEFIEVELENCGCPMRAMMQIAVAVEEIYVNIGDFMIQVDVVLLSVVYIETFGGYRISIRSCDDGIAANEMICSICEGIGSGGGHSKKSGGWVSGEQFRGKYGEMDFFSFLERRLNELLPDARR